MRKFTLSVCLSALALVSACSDRGTSTATAPADLQPRANIPVQPVCVTADSIGTLLDAAFVNGSPDENSALGKWSNIQKQQAAYLADPTSARLVVVQEKVLDLVDFILDKKNAGKLLTGADQATLDAFADLINALFCYAQLTQYFYPGGTAFFVYPTDLEQSLVDVSLQAAMHLPANAVSSPSLIAITRSNAPLATKFDQYGQTYEFSKYPIGNFTKPVVTEICVTVETPELFDKLVLGHTKSDGSFELLPEESPRLACTPPPATGTASLGDKVLSFLLPKKLFAAVMFGGGGVAGSLIELSPVRPVDPRIRVTTNTMGTSAPIGGTINPAPSVTLSTPLGTAFDGVPVAFSTNSGTITPSTVTSASVSGIASATSWTLGSTPGAVTATATPQVSGSLTAVPGAYFVDANLNVITSVTFDATATAPTKLVVTSGPTSGSQFIAGVTHVPQTVVEVQDAAGRVVPAFNGLVTMNAATGSTPQAIVGTPSVNAENGVARFSNLAITRTGTYSMTPSGAFGGGALSPFGAYSVVIAPASANTITAITPPLPATSTVNTAYNIVVEVRDGFGNLRPGTTVFFTPTPNPTNAAPTEVVTGANGRATFTWTVAFGTNTLFASLDATPVSGRFVEFTTDVAQSTSVSLTCSERGTREAITSTAVRLTAAPRTGSNVRPVSGVQFYFSVNGAASSVTTYPINVTARFTNASGVLETRTTSANVPLRGSASQDLAARFNFTPAFTPRANTPVIFSFQGPAQIERDIRVNVGPCGVNERRCAQACAAKTISSSGFDLFANPIVREGFKIDLFSNN